EKYAADSVTAAAEAINERSTLVSATFSKEGTLSKIEDAPLSGGADGEKVGDKEYKTGLELLENDIINIVLMAGKDAASASLLAAHLKKTAGNKRERIGVLGATGVEATDKNVASDRIILASPGIKAKTFDSTTQKEVQVGLPSSYMAAAVAGLMASLPVQSSPTNKVLAISGLTDIYNTGKLEKLVQNRVLAIEQREGFRVVKGITTATNTAWHQITTRRIVDYAIYGVRSGCNPYIGKLNNERVRNAMKATLDAFLTRMVNDEALISYELDVTATRAEQIQGIVQVNMTLRPTFSIDFIKVNMYLG
ncbi:MAG TPA: phage tail protein, partial [Cytophagales bacterium]|nr:phage tail protein [Cytophagales bacterium]